MITLADFFCGAGGSSTGALSVPGVELTVGLNHWDVAVETHAANHPGADHICADISQYDPRLVPHTDMAWLSPSCTKHSVAQGRKQADKQPDLFGETLPDEAAERSRATMWDVVRMAEYHQYQLVFVENVVEVTGWPPYRAWLAAMESLGYDHRVLMLNSMHAQLFGQGAPQSRDRFYCVFWRRGNRAPDLTRLTRPDAVCGVCGPVQAVQVFKRPGNIIGKFRQQYVYRCPGVKCRGAVLSPVVRPAADIIDWSLLGTRIGDRAKPLAAKTMARITDGIERYWGRPFITEHTHEYRVRSMATPLQTVRASGNHFGIAVPVEGRDGKQARPVTEPLRTATARNETGLAFIAELRGGGSKHRPTAHPLSTVSAQGNHHGLVTSYYGNGGATPTSESLPTVTTVERHSLLQKGSWAGSLDDVLFRMLEPAEYKRAMDFPDDYRMLGNRRVQVRLAGNAVCPPNARDLIGVAVESLGATS